MKKEGRDRFYYSLKVILRKRQVVWGRTQSLRVCEALVCFQAPHKLDMVAHALR